MFILEEPKESLPYFEKALAYNNPRNGASLIRLFVNYSSAYAKMEEFDKALEKIKTAEMIALQSGQDILNPDIFIQYASIYNKRGDYKESLTHCSKADSALNAAHSHDMRTQEKIHWNFALNYKETKAYDKAIHYFKLIENT